jgi:hypothetical protein
MADMAQDDTRSISARASQLRSNERRRPYINVPTDSQEADRVPSPTPSGPVPAGSSPANLVRTRRRAFRPSERLARHHRDRIVQNFAPPAPYTRPASPLPEPADPYAGRGSRAKRRKLDDGTYENESKAISYGFFGQAVPGQLKLEIASCDGGEYQDPHVPTTSWPRNVLEDDASVYCTKSNRCNMLLRHASGMPFSLTKIVVKAPRSGYDAPIQEGMIFVAMSDHDILEKTSHFETYYSPRNYRQHRYHFARARAEQEYVDPARSPLRTIDRTRYLRNPNAVPRRFENDPFLESAVIPGFDISTGPPSDDEALPTSPPSPRPWHEHVFSGGLPRFVDRYRPRYHEEDPLPHEPNDRSDNSSDSEDDLDDNLAVDAAEMAAVLNEIDEHDHDSPTRRQLRGAAARYRRRRAARLTGLVDPRGPHTDHSNRSDEDSDSDVPSAAANADTPSVLSRHRMPSTHGGYERINSDAEATVSSSKFPANGDSGVTVDESLSASDVVAPHARFYIPRNRSSVAVKFDPPVYVLSHPSVPTQLPVHSYPRSGQAR